MPILYEEGSPPESFLGSGGLAKEFKPINGSAYIDVHAQFPWTYSHRAKEDAPYIVLKEYAVNESAIKRQWLFYTTGAKSFPGSTDRLSPYAELFPKDRPTGFVYRLPFFTDINFELNTGQWTSLDFIEAAGQLVTGGVGTVFGKGAAQFSEEAQKIGGQVAMAGLSLGYPKIGIMDRPKLWESHDFRTYTIKFPLFNTKVRTTRYGEDDWKVNRDFCFLLLNQNLFNKRDFITSVPPVFYEVSIPGQHYSFASSVTNITIGNRGNIRLLKDADGTLCNVPDAYEVSITLTDMVMPSKNLLQTINEQTVISTVRKSTRVEGAVQIDVEQRAAAEAAVATVTGGTASQTPDTSPSSDILIPF